MTDKVEAITAARRKQLAKLMREVKAASPTVENDLKAYEAALTSALARVGELEARWSKVEDAHQDYENALRNREHGGVAADELVKRIDDLMRKALGGGDV